MSSCKDCIHYEVCDRNLGFCKHEFGKMLKEELDTVHEGKHPCKWFKEITCCKDCKYCDTVDTPIADTIVTHYFCQQSRQYTPEVKENEFCSRGEKR